MNPVVAPQTKAKALNYALPLVRGQFLVIYDAEDIPQKIGLTQYKYFSSLKAV